MNKENNNQFDKLFLTEDQQAIEHINNNGTLDSLIDQMAFQYLLLYVLTDTLLGEYFNYRKTSFSFPVDFFDVADWLHIDVIFDDLNYFRNKGFGKTIGELTMTESKKPLIVLDVSESVYSTRYALCHEISHYLCDQINYNCVWAQLPSSREEIVCDIIASFFMLPPKKTFESASEYTTLHNARPVDLEELFKYLSVQTGFPYYRVITAYEHLKTLACYLNSASYKETLKQFAKEQFSDDKWLYDKIKKTIDKGSIALKQFFL